MLDGRQESMKDWRSLGAAHRRRDEAAESITQAGVDRDIGGSMSSLGRWPAIVTAIRAQVAAYNDGAGRERLVVIEATDRQHPSVTVESSGPMSPALIVTLDEAEIRVDSRSAEPHAGGTKRWVDLTRSADDTAAYVLEDWMERL
jgi:hypothetical protein